SQRAINSPGRPLSVRSRCTASRSPSYSSVSHESFSGALDPTSRVVRTRRESDMKSGPAAAIAVPLLLATPYAQTPGDRPAANPRSTRSVVMGRNGMIAASQPLASAAGLKVLEEGGNAIDGAVAAAAVLAVVEPSMTGI